MRVLIIGLGSMGKRRIRNLLKLGYTNILGYDNQKDRLNEANKKYGIRVFSKLSEALIEKPDVMIISTPPNLHSKYAEIAIRKNIHFFMELNMFSKDLKILIKKMKGKSIIGVPSCTLRFHPVIKELKKLLLKKVIGNVLAIHHHTGQYLPNWHPWEDYRKFFVSKRGTGGARETLSFELYWLTYLFSNPKSVYANIDKVSRLDANIDDLYQVLLEFKNGIYCSLNVDVLSIPSFRETKIIGEKGTILCNFIKGELRINRGKDWKIIQLRMGKVAKGYVGSTAPEMLYEEELQSFLNAVIKKTKYPRSLREELATLSLLDTIETSHKKGKKIKTN